MTCPPNKIKNLETGFCVNRDGAIGRKIMANTAVFTFGRFNPPTVGHRMMIRKLIQVGEKENADIYVFGSHTKDKKMNPLSHSQKMKYMVEMFPKEMEGYVDPGEQIRTVFDAALYLNDYDRLIMIVGSDRVDSFKETLVKYNGKPLKNGMYEFSEILIVNAGVRDPDSEGIEGMSASKMRQAVVDNDMETFQSGLPKGYDGTRMFNDVKKGLGLN